MKPPSLEIVSKKAKQIDGAKNFSMKDEDIERVSGNCIIIVFDSNG